MPETGFPREAVLAELQLSPATFRRLVRDYAEVLGPAQGDELPTAAVAALRTIVALRSQGARRAEILAALQKGQGPEGEDIRQKLEAIREQLARAEEARIEDRDRLLTALLRTQQELAHLRGELLLSTSRRERRRRGLFRLFG